MIRIVHGKNPEGYRMMEAVEVPTEDPMVAEHMACAWAEVRDWTEVVVRKPKEPERVDNMRIHAIPTVEWLEKMLAAWQGKSS